MTRWKLAYIALLLACGLGYVLLGGQSGCESCTDNDGDGFAIEGGSCGPVDCDDADPAVNPNAMEGQEGDPTCSDGLDNDCDSFMDSDDPGCWECTLPEDCEDDNPCTDDYCLVDGTCLNANRDNGDPCDDDDDCTMDDMCEGGLCTGTPLDEDADTYTSEACGGEDCDDLDPMVHPGAVEGPSGDVTCEDALDNDCDEAVDEADTGCVDCAFPEECDDGNPCTDDDCIDSLCVHTNNADPCDDQDICTIGDACSDGVCGGGEPLDCDDENVCTDDDCHPDIGCYYTFNTDGCDDQDSCTTDDACWNGSCSGDPLDADDDAHTSDACGGDDCDDLDPMVHPDAGELPDAKDNDCDGLADEGLIEFGAVIVTEIMKNPSAVDDSVGEWFEVYNRTDLPMNMDSWVIRESAGGTDQFVVDEPGGLIVAPGGALVFCKNGDDEVNGGVVCDYEYEDFILSNSDDEIILELDGMVVSEVWYNDQEWPDPNGTSLNFDAALFASGNNNTGFNWCSTPAEPAFQLRAGDYGTPGRINPTCSGGPAVTSVHPNNGVDNGGEVVTIHGSGFTGATDVRFDETSCTSWAVLDENSIECTTPSHTYGGVHVTVVVGPESDALADGYHYIGEAVANIDWCDLHRPAETTTQISVSTELLYGRVSSPGQTGYGCPTPSMVAQVGYGPDGSDPRNDPGWTWTLAACNESVGSFDEYIQALTIPTPGTYAYGYRFSDDGAINFMYCDFDPGTANGFNVDDLGSLTVE